MLSPLNRVHHLTCFCTETTAGHPLGSLGCRYQQAIKPVAGGMMDWTPLAGAKDVEGNYIFGDEVRVPCGPLCMSLDCRGWTAATEGWEDHISPTFSCNAHIDTKSGLWVVSVHPNGQSSDAMQRGHEGTFKESLHAALTRAVEAMEGAELMEVAHASN